MSLVSGEELVQYDLIHRDSLIHDELTETWYYKDSQGIMWYIFDDNMWEGSYARNNYLLYKIQGPNGNNIGVLVSLGNTVFKGDIL